MPHAADLRPASDGHAVDLRQTLMGAPAEIG
jgi:hypothetical protein